VFWLMIYPITLGGGKRLFADGTIPAAFKVTESTVTAKGVIVVNYEQRAGALTTEKIGLSAIAHAPGRLVSFHKHTFKGSRNSSQPPCRRMDRRQSRMRPPARPPLDAGVVNNQPMEALPRLLKRVGEEVDDIVDVRPTSGGGLYAELAGALRLRLPPTCDEEAWLPKYRPPVACRTGMRNLFSLLHSPSTRWIAGSAPRL
jgi:hypothetical protein